MLIGVYNVLIAGDRRAGLPDPINTESEQWIALVYQIRNAFAHDISEPRWVVNGRYAREYVIGKLKVDLRGLDGMVFDYAHIGGAETLFTLKRYGLDSVLGIARTP